MQIEAKNKIFNALREYANELPDEIDHLNFIVWLKNNRPDLLTQKGVDSDEEVIKTWVEEYNAKS